MAFIGIVLLVILVNVEKGQNEIITKLENGVMVSEPKTIKLIQAQWKLYITIAPPTLINVEPYLNMLMNQISELEQDSGQMFAILRHNLQYLTAMNEHLSLKSTNGANSNSMPRHRRSLFDLGGKILHHLFGTATDADVQKCQQAINHAMTRQETIIHDYQAMTTVVQAIQNNTIENRNVMKTLSDYINRINLNVTDITQRVRKVNRVLWISQFIETVDMYTTENLRKQDQYYQKRADLELGTLTEHILPKLVLRQLLNKIKSNHVNLQPLPWTWYYENIMIEPMWQTNQMLIYTASLPFVSRDNYLMYHIQSFPVGVNSTSIQIKAEPLVIMDSLTNGLFLPKKCQGREPITCISGPITRQPLYNCEHGIISGHGNDIHDCLVDVQPYSKLPEIYNIPHADGNYVIHTKTDEITLNCPDKPSKSLVLTEGTFLIQVPPKCHVNSKDWTLTNIYFGQDNINIVSETLKVPILNSSILCDIANISDDIIQMPPRMRTLQNIKALTLPKFSEDEMDSHFISVVDKHQSKILITIVIIIFVIIIAGILFQIRKHGYFTKMHERMKLKSLTTRHETNASNITLTTPTESVPSLNPSNLYPILPVISEGISMPSKSVVSDPTVTTLNNKARE